MTILYNGVDIYPEVSVNHCWHDMYCERRPDELTIRFNDVRRLWDGWQPKADDKIKVEEGTASTGEMFVVSCKPENGFYTLRASALPRSAAERKCKSWDNVTLMQLLGEVAGNHGLTLETYGVTDRTYDYVEQRNVSDFELIQRRCMLEGAAIICYDGKMIVYDERTFEDAAPSGALDVATMDNFSYTDDSDEIFTRSELCNGRYTGKYSADVDASDRLLRQTIPIYAASQGEMDRWAKGILRDANKNAVRGVYYGASLLDGYAAGSTIDLTTTGASSWDGAFFITAVRNDYVFLTSKLSMRKPLGW